MSATSSGATLRASMPEFTSRLLCTKTHCTERAMHSAVAGARIDFCRTPLRQQASCHHCCTLSRCLRPDHPSTHAGSSCSYTPTIKPHRLWCSTASRYFQFSVVSKHKAQARPYQARCRRPLSQELQLQTASQGTLGECRRVVLQTASQQRSRTELVAVPNTALVQVN